MIGQAETDVVRQLLEQLGAPAWLITLAPLLIAAVLLYLRDKQLRQTRRMLDSTIAGVDKSAGGLSHDEAESVRKTIQGEAIEAGVESLLKVAVLRNRETRKLDANRLGIDGPPAPGAGPGPSRPAGGGL